MSRALVVGVLGLFALPASLLPAGVDRAAAGAAKPRDGVRVDRDLRYGHAEQMVLDVYRRRRSSRLHRAAVLVVHGGGWTSGDKRKMDGIARELARGGFVAFNVNYTLADRWRPGFPGQLRELAAAVRWIRRNSSQLRVDPARIGVLGSSAGGHLAGLLAVGGEGPLVSGARVRAAVTWSAPLDLSRLRSPALAPAVDSFLGCPADRCGARAAAASPATHATADDPPMLLFSSERELVPLSQAEEMASRLAAAGVPHTLWRIPGAMHATQYAIEALPPSIDFLRRRLR